MTLTNDDFKNIKDLVKITLNEDETLIRKDDIKHLPSKEEFYASEDRLMTELKAFREEMTILSGLHQKVNDHEERIENIEEVLKIQPAI